MKVNFWSMWDNVWVDYINTYFKNKDNYDINWQIGSQIDLQTLSEADVSVLMWANEYASEFSKMRLKYCKKLVIFVRSYEIFFGHLRTINWKNVDDCVFVNKAFYDEFKPHLLKAGCKRVHYIENAIDINKWNKQEHNKSYNVGWVANLNHKKGLDLIPQFVYELVKIDSKYHLHLAGEFQNERHIRYVKHLLKEMDVRDNVTFYNKVDNIKEWLKDKDYLFTCSVTEGHPNNVIEAMSLGIKPIIHNWAGAKYNFPKELIWNSISEAVNLVTEDKYNSDYYRKYAKYNFDLFKVYPKLEAILRS